MGDNRIFSVSLRCFGMFFLFVFKVCNTYIFTLSRKAASFLSHLARAAAAGREYAEHYSTDRETLGG